LTVEEEFTENISTSDRESFTPPAPNYSNEKLFVFEGSLKQAAKSLPIGKKTKAPLSFRPSP
jgi:hypothetical protein